MLIDNSSTFIFLFATAEFGKMDPIILMAKAAGTIVVDFTGS